MVMNKLVKKSAFYGIILLSITSCATSNPEMVNVVNGNEEQLSCYQLNQEYEKAKIARNQARAEDKFMMKHINPFAATVSIYKMNKAERLGKERMQYLAKIINSGSCKNNKASQQKRRPSYNQGYYQNSAPYGKNNFQQQVQQPQWQQQSQPMQQQAQPWQYQQQNQPQYRQPIPQQYQPKQNEQDTAEYYYNNPPVDGNWPQPPSNKPKAGVNKYGFPNYDPSLLNEYENLSPEDAYKQIYNENN